MTLNEIIMALPQLTSKERALLHTALDNFMPPSDSQDPTAPLYDGIRTCMKATMPFNAFKTTTAYKVWKRDAARIIKFTDKLWPTAIESRTLRLGLFTFLIGLLRDDLAARKVTPSLSALVRNLSRIPAIFDRELPGYREAGLADIILHNISKGKHGRPTTRKT